MTTITIKKADQKQTYRKKLSGIRLKGLNAHKYAGKIKISLDPLVIQKKLRDEWK